MPNFEPIKSSDIEESSQKELIESYEYLESKVKELNAQYRRLLRNIDQFKLDGEHRTEMGMTLMAGVLLRNLRRRQVVVRPEDFKSFSSNRTVSMSADEDGVITYKLDGDFDDDSEK